jgi:hypothetical protein
MPANDEMPRGMAREIVRRPHGLPERAMVKVKRNAVTPGEGERRAQRGYVPQYDFAAHAIRKAIAAGTLQWIGLADRSAGNFDDLVLGLSERVIAHQIKTSSNPKKFNVRTLMLGSNALLASLTRLRLRPTSHV